MRVFSKILHAKLHRTFGTRSQRYQGKLRKTFLNGRIKILYDNRIIYEYIDVLSRQEFGFHREAINDMIDFLKRDGEFINAEHLKIKCSDEADKKFYEVYKFGDAQYLITGNKKHFPNEETIIIPKDFLQKYENWVYKHRN